MPEILYRYGKAEAAYDQILDLTREGKNRREYPEVSYSVIGAIVTGLMGMELVPAEPEKSLEQEMYVDRMVTTLSHLTSRTKWAELKGIPVRANELTLRHDGLTSTTLTNVRGPALIWNACFQGAHKKLLVDGKPVEVTPATPHNGYPESTCTVITVDAGETKVSQALD